VAGRGGTLHSIEHSALHLRPHYGVQPELATEVVVQRARDFRDQYNGALRWRYEPEAIPGGQLGGFEDDAGNVIYVMDQAGA
jgi:hypothetical protein